MGKGSTFDNDFLKLTFQAAGIAGLADNAASSPNTNLYFALHTAPPATDDQTSNEVTYTSYARTAVARTSGGFTVTANSVSPVANVVFPAGTGGGGVATNFSVGITGSGSSKVLYTGAISPSITLGNGVTPILTTSSNITEA